MTALAPTFQDKALCMTFDGKKLKQGLTADSGDIDLLGFEDGKSLLEKQADLELEIDRYNIVLRLFSKYDLNDNVNNLTDEEKEQVINDLKLTHKKVSMNLKEAREIKEKKEYARKKFEERGGKDWRNGKFVFVISAIDAFVYELNQYIDNSFNIISDICNCLAYIQNSLGTYVSGHSVDVTSHSRYIPVEKNESPGTRQIKQRTPGWFELRNKAKVTGSVFYNAIGLDGLKKQREHFLKVICGQQETAPSEEALKNMEYGTKNEINATATLIGKILPVYEPQLVYQEEGCITFDENNSPFLVVSPDGSLKDKVAGETKMAVEFKCPVKKIHTEFPVRYYLQCISEIEALDVEQLLYVCWRPDITTAFIVSRDTETFREALTLAREFLNEKFSKRPTKLDTRTKTLKEKIKKIILKVEFLGEFQSIAAGGGECLDNR
ncbi:uncharacterized protein LOC123553445 [Mercenaria mercenaria]|uniref:uncharacterized protein LOC123553445 n=1 Tax=Mercenaria mercenaria TaxID=6596 RepID=UPI00234E8559|nr:uncharacterized protein LOC123553445 [Mercenaria mercenaria]